jgi:hypothetical protein
LRIQTRGNSNVVWLSSGEGVINGTMSLSAPTLEKILQAINEKYGTSFEGWSQKPTVYEVGDTVPNWNAYEKIEMPQPFLWKMKVTGAQVSVFGKVENNVLTCYASSLEKALVANDEGLVVGSYNVDESFFTDLVKPKLAELGISYTKIGYDTSTYSVNDNVDNWDDFTDIS